MMSKEPKYPAYPEEWDDTIPGLIREEFARQASVLVPVVNVDGQTHLLFEVRASNLSDQPGDICFPGGMIEPGEGRCMAAMRECSEELLVQPEQICPQFPVNVMAGMCLTIYPFVGTLTGYLGTKDEEVAETFTVPFDFFLETEPLRSHIKWKIDLPDDFPAHLVNGGRNYKWRRQEEDQLFYQYKDRVIWGLTARIIYHSLVKAPGVAEKIKNL